LVIAAGEGAFVIEKATASHPPLAEVPRLLLSETLGSQHSQAACAYALARLAREQSI
jgi:hypothetical protein